MHFSWPNIGYLETNAATICIAIISETTWYRRFKEPTQLDTHKRAYFLSVRIDKRTDFERQLSG